MIFDDNRPWSLMETGDCYWQWVGDPNTPVGNDKALVCLRGRTCRCSSFIKLYELKRDASGKWLCRDVQYMLPNAQESLVSDMAELSLTHTIVGIVAVKYGVGIALVESRDGTTNIDADFISELPYGSRR